MIPYKLLQTSTDVFVAIRSSHGDDLRVFGSYSAPERGIMFTSFGLRGAECPLIEAETTWDVDDQYGYDPATPARRLNEKHQYWLCIPVEED